jgi:hypothetical protein
MGKSVTKLWRWAALGTLLFATGWTQAQEIQKPDNDKRVPQVLEPWQDWVTWDDRHRDCPTPYNSAKAHICFWPSRLTVSANANGGRWESVVTVFERTWVPLPGNDKVWPLDVRTSGEPIPVVARDGTPSVRLPAGVHTLAGSFVWDEMPQRIAIPPQIGILSLVVAGQEVAIPNWDANGDVWLKRIRGEVADKDLLGKQVYRVVEDGIPLWLRTEIELTVSGKSREEELGWILPVGWKLSLVDSPIPVAVDGRGRMKAQVRAGKWTIRVDAFRASDVGEFQFAPGAKPVADVELVAFAAEPDFRMAEFEGVSAVDVTQTTFPKRWRGLPTYQWDTSTSFRLVEKMRGMGLQRPQGLSIARQFWLDEDGRALTYRDHITGQMQQIWRLDVADGNELGAVRIDGQGQLITANPQTQSHGVEIRARNLNLDALGRVERTPQLAATGWQTDADSLSMTFALPPGWRVFAIFGADQVQGDWLTAWSLLDLFLLMIFSLAVFRLWGFTAGIVAFLAFGLAYHEPGAPRLTWLFILLPVALLRVVPEGAGRRWVGAWRALAAALLLLLLVPFVAKQVQSTIYPQLETPGMNYSAKQWFGLPSESAPRAHRAAVEDIMKASSDSFRRREGRIEGGSEVQLDAQAKFSESNLLYDPKAKIQTGPAEPEWSWNQVRCKWDGPVSADQKIKPILISLSLHRILNVVRLLLLLVLAAILFGARDLLPKMGKRHTTSAILLASLFLFPFPKNASAQFPDPDMLNTLRKRLIEAPDIYPRAAEIASVNLIVSEGRVTMHAEIHAAGKVAVPLPGRFPAWSPLSVQLDQQPESVVCRVDGYLWIVVPQGVHRVVVEGRLPVATEWEWTFLLKPRRVSIDADNWNVTGIGHNGIPEQQVFFTRKRQASDREAAYDRKDFHAIVAVDRHLEVGLIWQVHNKVTRLSAVGKAISLRVPLLAHERVLSPNTVVRDGLVEVRLGANEETFSWESELPIGDDIALTAAETDQWVERWHLVTSPVWNVSQSGLAPIFESQEENLIPVWRPWPGENVTLQFSRPEAVSGDTITVQRVKHEVTLGSRQRNSKLAFDVECSLGEDFAIDLGSEAEISSLTVDGQRIPVRLSAGRLVVPLHPGKQTVLVAWRTSQPMQRVVDAGTVALPVEAANISTVIRVPESRWILWARGPLRGPAVRFWSIVVCAILAALVLGSLPQSPIGRPTWVLLALGLTQVPVGAAMLVVGWFFLLAWRGSREPDSVGRWRFNLMQVFLVLLTFAMLAVLVVVVGEGLLGDPEMFIVGNHSSRRVLQWFQPRVSGQLPLPQVVSISVWVYRLLMLFWALWLAAALIRWLQWGWNQFSSGGTWKRRTVLKTSVDEAS